MHSKTGPFSAQACKIVTFGLIWYFCHTPTVLQYHTITALYICPIWETYQPRGFLKVGFSVLPLLDWWWAHFRPWPHKRRWEVASEVTCRERVSEGKRVINLAQMGNWPSKWRAIKSAKERSQRSWNFEGKNHTVAWSLLPIQNYLAKTKPVKRDSGSVKSLKMPDSES